MRRSGLPRTCLLVLTVAASSCGCRGILDIEPVGTEPDLVDASDFDARGDASMDDESAADSFSADSLVGEAGDPEVCPALAGEKMIAVDAPTGAYCIDATEVTRAAFAQFIHEVTTDDYAALMPQACTPLTSPKPSAGCDPYPSLDLEDTFHASFPVSCVDWCDAYAYCRWAGKRLCGALGGGSVPPSQYDNPASGSEWTWACASGQQDSVYPYGDSYSPKRCNGWDFKEGNYGSADVNICFKDPGVCTTAAGAMSQCRTPTGIYDQSGNVWEWEDACNDGVGLCRTRGGGFDEVSLEPALRCDSAYSDSGVIGFDRRGRHAAIGFRCCADAVPR